MSYSKRHSPWVDYPGTSTPILAEDLDHIEQGIYDAHASTAKGDLVVAAAANDLRRLAVGTNNYGLVADSAQTLGVKWADLGTLLVPLSILDAKGDLIVGSAADTAMRLPVGSNGQVLTADSTTAGGLKWASASGSIAVTAGLPTSPNDGDKIVLVDSTSAPTYAWLLQYINAKSSNKWQAIGAPPAVVAVSALETTASTAYANLSGGATGPSFTIPVAGDYIISHGAYMANSSASVMYMSYAIGATAASDNDSTEVQQSAAAANSQSPSRTRTKALTAVTLLSKYRTSAGTASFKYRWLSVTPIAVGG